jgi:hypothetical protein
VRIVGYLWSRKSVCGCGAIISFHEHEVQFNQAGVGVVKCPNCGAYPVVMERN